MRPSNHRYLNGPGQTGPKAGGPFSVLHIFMETNWTKSFSILHIFLAGLGIHSLFFRKNCSFFESESVFHSCQSANRFRRYFLMSDGSECRLLQQFTLLCWAQTGERGKWEKHDENLKQITFKNSKSRFHKERITPVTLYLKTTFFPVTLFLK